MTSCAYCHCTVCLEKFPKLIKSCGGSWAHVKPFYFMATDSTVLRHAAEKCFSLRHFVWKVPTCSCYLLIDVLTWLQWTLCLRGVKGQKESWRAELNSSLSCDFCDHSYGWLSSAPQIASNYCIVDFICTGRWASSASQHKVHTVKICIAQCFTHTRISNCDFVKTLPVQIWKAKSSFSRDLTCYLIFLRCPWSWTNAACN